jgi:tetratricopeptide (TPR) repeat protein
MMIKLLPKELLQARELIDQAKFREALEIIEKFEKGESLSPEDQLSTLLTKARIYAYSGPLEKYVKLSESAYQMSQDLGLVAESIEALIGKAYILWIGDIDKATSYVLDAERMLNSLADDSSTRVLRRNLLFIKSWTLNFKVNFRAAAKSARECLRLSKEQGNKLNLASGFNLLGWINLNQGNRVRAFDYAMKGLEYNKDLNFARAIAGSYSLIASIYLTEGDYDQAMDYCKKSLAIKEIPDRVRLATLEYLAEIYFNKSELHRSLKYRQKALVASEELNAIDRIALNLHSMGYTYMIKEELDKAIEYLVRSLTIAEKFGLPYQMAVSLCFLSIIYFEKNSRETANRYFSRLSDLFERYRNKGEANLSFWYLYSKASMMMTSIRIRDRMEAQALFKELIALGRKRGSVVDYLFFPMGNLCVLLLEELSINNDPAILDEITPLITESLDMAERLHNYRWLANTKLLQGKMALLQMKFEEAKQFLTQAQRIAELHGLHLLAQVVSEEHDKLITQLNDWDNLRKNNAPMAERIKLASTHSVLERIQGKRAVVPPELVNEQSTVLLILAEGGVLVFSYPFSDEWKIDEDLFSSFLSAFASFSTEFFSQGIDRVKFGNDILLMESIGSISFCYLFKGQTYSARQKLKKFIEQLQKNSLIWQNLERHHRAGQILEIKESPQIESLIIKIFKSNNQIQ